MHVHFNFLAGQAGFQMTCRPVACSKRGLVRLVSPHFSGLD